MHTFNESGTGVPAFLAKLWRLVEDPETNNLICWSKDGLSFVIKNQAQFARELLPLNYKHNNMASFIRQLNMYGFHKITSIENGGLKFDRDEMEFSHLFFKRNYPHLLEHIKRKIANTKGIEEKTTYKPEAVSKVLNDVKAMRGRQDSLDSKFSVMKQENEALWREIASLRQKHAKQQQIVNKLIQFLITVVSPSRNMTSVKRNMQLMINDTPGQGKLRKNSESGSESGPVIHELGEELLDEYEGNAPPTENPVSPCGSVPSVESNQLDNDATSPFVEIPRPNASKVGPNRNYLSQSSEEEHESTIQPGPEAPAIINAVTPDGTQIVYHVTEVPDNIQESPEIFTEENHLTTPMVKQMKRNEALKQKNKQLKRKIDLQVPSSSSHAQKATRTNKKIKIEAELSPLMYLRSDANELPSMPATNDSLVVENSPEIIGGSDIGNLGQTASGTYLSQKHDNQVAVSTNNDDVSFHCSDFISPDMPSDLFEESPLIQETRTFNSINYNKKDETKQKNAPLEKQVSKQPSVEKNPFEYNLANQSSSSSKSNMQVAKVYNSPNLVTDNSRDDVHLHLDGMQDDLDSLKELLRGDAYSLDANTLLGLFNESDMLGPYGLVMTPDASGERRGSELAMAHPIYDLSDIIGIDDKNEDPNSNNCSSPQPESVLNTPQHK